MELVTTGIPSLDRLLGGGIPMRQSIIVAGQPGSGKTILCSQVAFAQAARGSRVVLATATSEPNEKLIEELGGFSFFDSSLIGDRMFIVSAYPWFQRGPREARDVLLASIRDRGAKLLFLDGLRVLRDLWDNEAKVREFLYDLCVGIAHAGAVGLFTTEYPLHRLIDFPEATTVDGIISLSANAAGDRTVRRAQVAKLRGRPHLTGEHVLHIDDNGVHVVPRLEAITPRDGGALPTGPRAAFGIPELDAALDGGFPAASTTLLGGGTGVGKTLLALKFAATGAEAGEPAVFASYTEPAARLVARARAVGVDVEPMVRDGRLTMLDDTVGEREADDVVASLLACVDRVKAKRLVVDGIGDFEDALVDPTRKRRFFHAFIAQLRSRGVTTVFVKEDTQVAGVQLDLRDTPSSVVAENVILVRHVEHRGKLRRVLSILKLRESAFDPVLREFAITPQGIALGGTFQEVHGVLTGIAYPWSRGWNGADEGHA